ncbi:hypothetical protein K1X22_21965 [Mycolicibacterium farcinogenes]|uniref:hypothetical protein n=1 Tax=Mycolicibacterium farcinogenes TaxID=1802 RepID=UPI001C8EC694|nr:hypothetical protein [Mycolicibacterium farcinogenes]QZH58891.1 hypothetical protein K1X22_21965 [Mycolicibacterium farcinogenes]
MTIRHHVSTGKYYWKTPREGGWLPREWAYTPEELDAVSALTATERMSRWVMRTLLRADAFAARAACERLAMTAVRRHEQADALSFAGNCTRTATVVSVEDTGISVDGGSSPQMLADAAVIVVTIEIDGGRSDAVTLVPRTTAIAPAQDFRIVDHPDDPIPLWVGR